MPLVVAIVGFALSLSGCSLVRGYPDRGTEDTREACTDAEERDEDWDGLANCEDDSCDGWCAEASAAACENGRDDDADTLRDAHDPGCFWLAPPRFRSCATAFGTDRDLVDSTWGGDAVSIPDPTGRHARVLAVDPGAHATESGVVTTGSIDGMHLELETYLDPRESFSGIELAPIRSGAAALERLTIQIFQIPGSGEIFVYTAVRTVDYVLSVEAWSYRPAPGVVSWSWWYVITLDVRGTSIAVDIDVIDADGARFALATGTLERPETWGPVEPLRMAWLAERAGESPLLLGRARVRRARVDPCGHEVPSSEIGGQNLAAIGRRGADACAVVSTGPEESAAAALRSSDGAATWADVGTVGVTPALPEGVALGLDAEWRPDPGGLLTGVTWGSRDRDPKWPPPLTHLFRARTGDCTSWEIEDLLVPLEPRETTPGGPVIGHLDGVPLRPDVEGVAFGPIEHGGPAVHEIFVGAYRMVNGVASGADLVVLRSADGAPGSWSIAERVDLPTDDLASRATPSWSLRRIGHDLVALRAAPGDGRLRLYAPYEGSFVEVARLEPADAGTSFDEAITSGHLVVGDPVAPGEPWRWRVLYDGLSIRDALPVFAWGDAELLIAPAADDRD